MMGIIQTNVVLYHKISTFSVAVKINKILLKVVIKCGTFCLLHIRKLFMNNFRSDKNFNDSLVDN